MRRRPRRKLSRAERRRKLAALGQDDELPDDIDERRNALARRIHMFMDTWRGCPEPACRRHRRCTAPKIECTNAPPRRPLTPEQQGKVTAQVYRVVRELAARHESGT